MTNIKDEILQELKAAIGKASQKDIDVDHIGMETNIREEIDLDSIDMLDLMFELQEMWHVDIEDDVFSRIETIGDLVSLRPAAGSRRAVAEGA